MRHRERDPSGGHRDQYEYGSFFIVFRTKGAMRSSASWELLLIVLGLIIRWSRLYEWRGASGM